MRLPKRCLPYPAEPKMTKEPDTPWNFPQGLFEYPGTLRLAFQENQTDTEASLK